MLVAMLPWTWNHCRGLVATGSDEIRVDREQYADPVLSNLCLIRVRAETGPLS